MGKYREILFAYAKHISGKSLSEAVAITGLGSPSILRRALRTEFEQDVEFTLSGRIVLSPGVLDEVQAQQSQPEKSLSAPPARKVSKRTDYTKIPPVDLSKVSPREIRYVHSRLSRYGLSPDKWEEVVPLSRKCRKV